ncbi:hypothetical protein JCM8208_003011 [Rhodotorula glutinis]
MCRPRLGINATAFDPQSRTPPPRQPTRPRRPSLELSPYTRHFIDQSTGEPLRSPSAPPLGRRRPQPVFNEQALAALTRPRDEVLPGEDGVLDPAVAHLYGSDAWLHIGNTDRARRLARARQRAAHGPAHVVSTPSPVWSMRSASAPVSPGVGEPDEPFKSWFSAASSSSGDDDKHDVEPPLRQPNPGFSAHRGRLPGLVLSPLDTPAGAVRHLALPAIGSPFGVALPALAPGGGRTPSPELRRDQARQITRPRAAMDAVVHGPRSSRRPSSQGNHFTPSQPQCYSAQLDGAPT